MLYQCTQPWCSHCQQSWTSINDPKYHIMSKCPIKYPERRQAPFQAIAPRPMIPTIQSGKRSFNEQATDAIQPRKQPFAPRPTRSPFPPRGTGPKQMRSNTVTSSSQDLYEDEIDYNDIQSLRAYAIRTQQSQSTEEQNNMLTQVEQDDYNQDADWDPEQQS